MAEPIIHFTARRLRNAAWLLGAVVVAVAGYRAYGLTLHNTAFATGWALFVTLLLLAAYNLRKKLPFLPLGRSAAWLQLHIYGGLGAVVLFVLHVGMRLPNGALDLVLAALFTVLAATGIAGIAVSRLFAPRLTRYGENVIHERIPALRVKVREQAEELVLQSVTEADSTAIAEFYNQRLLNFFARPRNLLAHLTGSTRHLHNMLSDIGAMRRYLSEREQELMDELARLVESKDNLDFQHARQGVLKLWLFAHVPLTYSLLVFVAVHLVIVYAFAGGTP